MTKEQLVYYIECGREIEFIYEEKKYSITYGIIDNKSVISFCEFYKESVEVETAEELCNIKYCDITVLEMLEKLGDESIWIY